MQLAKALRARIEGGVFALGTFVVELRTPALARFLQQATFDFMLVDNEHGYWNPLDIAQHIDAGKRWGICPLVRVAGPERGEIMRALDAGAEGVPGTGGAARERRDVRWVALKERASVRG